MTLDTITFALDEKTVPLEDFAEAVAAFSEMVRGLSKDVGAPDLEWVIEDLQAGSATASVRCSEPDRAAPVVIAYGRVGEAASTGAEIPFESAKRPLRRIREILNRRGEVARFETPEREYIVRPEVAPEKTLGPMLVPRTAQGMKPSAPLSSLGAVVGRIQTLTNRGALRFTVFDLLYDKAISCYLADGQESRLVDKWGKIAVVEGAVSRDPITGRPLAVRQITGISEIAEQQARDYLETRGCSPPLSNVSPEAAIRKLRDA